MNKQLFLILACGLAVLSAQEKKAPAEPQKAEKQSATQPGMRVYKDPVTGELRAPTAAELQAERQSSIGSGNEVPPQIVRNADGSYSAELGPQHMTYSVMRKNADGTFTMECVTGEKKAAAFLNQSKPPVDFANKSTVTERPNEK